VSNDQPGGAMRDSSSLSVAQQGFDAWRRGDFDALEEIFAPDVQWRWFEPGEWDCHSRKDVMRTLRQRPATGFAEGRLKLHDAGPDVVVVTAYPSEIGGPEWPEETSTVIRFRAGKVVSMQDYRTEAEALAATG
jgi:ketosteroid isomerase-like protein